MSHDRDLIDTIKANFARKSSSQLEAIARGNDPERWSAEAIVAAGEALQDRREGRAQEPAAPEEEAPPPPPVFDTYGLAVAGLAAFGLLAGYFVIPLPRRDYAGSTDPDLPVPFGPKMAWLALDTRDTEAVAAALSLRATTTATWADGIRAAHQASVFVTPPLADWTLVAGTPLFPTDPVGAFVKPLVERMSRQFGDAQYFCTHRDVELHVWARARRERLVRGYGWLGEKGLTLWDECAPTKEERHIGFRFSSEQSIAVEPARNMDGTLPDEAGVMQLACLWSIDPTTLDRHFKEPVTGLLGKSTWAEGPTRRQD
jgi:hypothetical protein